MQGTRLKLKETSRTETAASHSAQLQVRQGGRAEKKYINETKETTG